MSKFNYTYIIDPCIKCEKYHLAKAAMIRDTKANIVSAWCSACRMQISNSLYVNDVKDVVFKNQIELIAEVL